jgi:hypothetical protein
MCSSQCGIIICFICIHIPNFAIISVRNKFCKYILGLKNCASNIASRSELGRLPIDCFIKTQSLLYEDSIFSKFSKMLSSYNNDCVLIKQSIGSLPSSDLDAMLLAQFFEGYQLIVLLKHSHCYMKTPS